MLIIDLEIGGRGACPGLVRFRLQDGMMGILTGKHIHNTIYNTHYANLYM